jgi:hypothetical protein
MTRALIPGGAHCASPQAPSSELDHGRGRHCTGRALRAWRAPQRIVLIDCLTLWPSNLLFTGNAAFPGVGPVALPLTIIREHYPDFGPPLAYRKLREVHGIVLRKETVRKLMSNGGLRGRADSNRRQRSSLA